MCGLFSSHYSLKHKDPLYKITLKYERENTICLYICMNYIQPDQQIYILIHSDVHHAYSGGRSEKSGGNLSLIKAWLLRKKNGK